MAIKGRTNYSVVDCPLIATSSKFREVASFGNSSVGGAMDGLAIIVITWE